MRLLFAVRSAIHGIWLKNSEWNPFFAVHITDICQYTVNVLLRNYRNYSPDNTLDAATKRTVGEYWVLKTLPITTLAKDAMTFITTVAEGLTHRLRCSESHGITFLHSYLDALENIRRDLKDFNRCANFLAGMLAQSNDERC